MLHSILLCATLLFNQSPIIRHLGAFQLFFMTMLQWTSLLVPVYLFCCQSECCFSVDPLEFSRKTILSWTKKWYLSFSPIVMIHIYFWSFYSLRNFRTIVNSSGNSNHPRFVLGINEVASWVSLLRMTWLSVWDRYFLSYWGIIFFYLSLLGINIINKWIL